MVFQINWRWWIRRMGSWCRPGSWLDRSRRNVARTILCHVDVPGAWRCTIFPAACRTTLPIETLLILESLLRSIVLLAPRVGLLTATVLTAAERTVKISPMHVPRMRQKANPTVAAVDRTACQTGMIAQDRIQGDLILTNKRTSAVVLMPIRAKRKEFPGGDDKNPRFSVRMLSVFFTPSSYELHANPARARARFFHGLHPIESKPTGANARRDTNCQPGPAGLPRLPKGLFFLTGDET
jgi:hypothetical protein